MSFRVKWLGQGGYELFIGDKTLMIDPYMADFIDSTGSSGRMVPPAYAFGQVHPDYLLCTHDHLDHLDVDLVKAMDKTNVTFLGPDTVCADLLSHGVDASQIIRLNRGESITLDSFTLTAYYAEHTEDSIGVKAEYCGRALYFTGDSLYGPKTAEGVEGIDVLFTCINGRLGNMNAKDAAKLTKRIAPRVAVPNHYGMFKSNTADPKTFTAEVAVTSGIPTKIHKYLEVMDIDILLSEAGTKA